MQIPELTVIEGPRSLGIGSIKTVEKQILAGLHAGGSLIVLDLCRTHSIDGAGIGVLLWAQERARRAGSQLRFAAPTPAVREFLQPIDLHDDLTFHDSVEEALQVA